MKKETKIIDSELSVRSISGLRTAGIETIRDLIELEHGQLIKKRGIGLRVLCEVYEFMLKNNLNFSPEIKDISDSELSTRALNILRDLNFGYHSDNPFISDLRKLKRRDLFHIRNCGAHTISEIESFMLKRGIKFADQL